MRPRYLIGLALSLLTMASGARSQSDTRLNFDTIFDLPYVYSLEFGSGGRELFVAVEGHLLQWKLQPLNLIHNQPTQILANEMVFGPDQILYSVGLGRVRGSFNQAGSKAVAFGRVGGDGNAFEVLESNSNLGISQYSSVAFDSAGNAILASASSFTASPFPRVKDVGVKGSRVYPQLKFRCGGVSQLSIFPIDGIDHYVASIAGQATLEFGKLDLGSERSAPSDCFLVQQMEKGQKRQPTFDAVRHAVIDLDDTPFASEGATKAIMVLDPNSNQLSMFRIEPFGKTQFLSRLGALQIDLSQFLPTGDHDAVLTDLSTDTKGREIHISSNSASVVLRFGFDGTGLNYRGRIATGAPVQRLEMSDDGAAAAIVTGREPFGGDWRIIMISNPAALSDWLQVPASFPSIRHLQEQLNAQGLTAGFPDGILGPQTTTAITAFLNGAGNSLKAKNPDPAAKALYRTIVSSFPKYLLEETRSKQKPD